MTNDSHEGQRARSAIRELISELPADYASRYAALTAISHVFHEELGHALQPALAQEAKRLESMDLAKRRAWVSNRNIEVRRLHLAFRCSKTGRPAILIADSKDGTEDYLRYRLQIYEGSRSVRTYTGRELPPLDIIEDDPRIENLIHTGPGRSQRGSSR